MGYEVYTSAFADVLCEPSLSMPLTVGMYARWGSGKSFVLRRLQGITLRKDAFVIANSLWCFSPKKQFPATLKTLEPSLPYIYFQGFC